MPHIIETNDATAGKSIFYTGFIPTENHSICSIYQNLRTLTYSIAITFAILLEIQIKQDGVFIIRTNLLLDFLQRKDTTIYNLLL